MIDLLIWLLTPFTVLYRADDRPEARRLTVGCAVVVFALAGLLFFWIFWQRGFK